MSFGASGPPTSNAPPLASEQRSALGPSSSEELGQPRGVAPLDDARCMQPSCLEMSEAYDSLVKLLEVKDQMIWQLIQERNDLAVRLRGT